MNEVLTATIVTCYRTILIVIKLKFAENLVVESSSAGYSRLQQFVFNEILKKIRKNCQKIKLTQFLK